MCKIVYFFINSSGVNTIFLPYTALINLLISVKQYFDNLN